MTQKYTWEYPIQKVLTKNDYMNYNVNNVIFCIINTKMLYFCIFVYHYFTMQKIMNNCGMQNNCTLTHFVYARYNCAQLYKLKYDPNMLYYCCFGRMLLCLLFVNVHL